ncbi:MAG: hypothetical protein ACPGFA_01150 [Pikeienuella sp.]
MLAVYGFINRSHIMRKFGLSNAAAALTIKDFNTAHPGAMAYDAIRKCYVATNEPTERKAP